MQMDMNDQSQAPMDIPNTVPDFVIAGAMKSGTTWLHDALNQIDGVFIPRDEVHWMDARDPLAHPDFHSVTREGLRLRRSEDTCWFGDEYPEADGATLFGYDSTTIIHSHVDFRRLAAALPKTRFIVVLRDPVARAYSHYWHLLRTGRTRFRFEREILEGRQEILTRSLYLAGAERMVSAFGSRVLFVCYERIFREPEVELGRITDFLGLPAEVAEQMATRLHRRSNSGRYPRFMQGWMLASRLLSGLERGRYASALGGDASSGLALKLRSGLYWFKIAVMMVLGLGFRCSAPQMLDGTRRELAGYFAEANNGLDDRTGVPFSRYWNVE